MSVGLPTCWITPWFMTTTRSRHGQRFFLVVGDIDEGDARALLDALELDLHVLAQLEVQGAERLVEQQHTAAR